MTKAIIGLPALIKDTLSKKLSVLIRKRVYNTKQRAKALPYGSMLTHRKDAKLSTFYKIILQKDNEFILMNTLSECLLVYCKDQNAVFDKILEYCKVMRSDKQYSNYYSTIYFAKNNLIQYIQNYPDVHRNRDNEIELIYGVTRIFPVFFDQYYTVQEAKQILSDPKKLEVNIGGEQEDSTLLKTQLVAFFSKEKEDILSLALSTDSNSSEDQLKEYIEQATPITTLEVVNSPKESKIESIKEKMIANNSSNLSEKLKPIIIDLVHQYLDEAIDKLADTIAEEVSDCANEAIRFRNEKIKESVQKLLSDLDK